VFRGDAPILVVPALVQERRFSWLDMPARPFVNTAGDGTALAAASAALVRKLEAMLREGRLASWEVGDLPVSAHLSPLGTEALACGAVPRLMIRAEHDLTLDEAAMVAHLRRRFRPMINWGRENIRITVVDRANPDAQAFAAYRAFHLSVAGRTTRPEASWDEMYSQIASGGGELQLGHLADGRLVAGLMGVDGTDVAAYASGVFDRSMFHHPLAHWPMWNAILRARHRRMTVFDLGETPPPGAGSAKEQGIAQFKRGFATRLVPVLSWHRLGVVAHEVPAEREAVP
jgi:hypothetical protein